MPFGYDIEIRKIHHEKECPICIMERMRSYCDQVIDDHYMPRHNPRPPYDLKNATMSDVCKMGENCRCKKMAMAI